MIQEKIKSLNELQLILANPTNNDKKVVFTNGCFDILHAGHVQYLESAKELGDLFIIGINSDRSIKVLKGQGRPVNTQTARALVLAALESVDYITIFNEPTPLELIKKLKPHILAKGGDWPIEEIVGRQEVESYKGMVKTIPFIPGYSTSSLIAKIHAMEVCSSETE